MEYVPLYVYVDDRVYIGIVFSIAPTLILEVGFLTEPGIRCSVYVMWLACLRDQRSSCLFLHPSAGFTGQLFHECWGCKLKSSYLH